MRPRAGPRQAGGERGEQPFAQLCGAAAADDQVQQPVGGAGFVAEQGAGEAVVLDQGALGDAAPGIVEGQRVRRIEPSAAASSRSSRASAEGSRRLPRRAARPPAIRGRRASAWRGRSAPATGCRAACRPRAGSSRRSATSCQPVAKRSTCTAACLSSGWRESGSVTGGHQEIDAEAAHEAPAPVHRQVGLRRAQGARCRGAQQQGAALALDAHQVAVLDAAPFHVAPVHFEHRLRAHGRERRGTTPVRLMPCHWSRKRPLLRCSGSARRWLRPVGDA
jgi:hypothetical protein